MGFVLLPPSPQSKVLTGRSLGDLSIPLIWNDHSACFHGQFQLLVFRGASCPDCVNHLLQQWSGEHLWCAGQVPGTGGPGAHRLDRTEGGLWGCRQWTWGENCDDCGDTEGQSLQNMAMTSQGRAFWVADECRDQSFCLVRGRLAAWGLERWDVAGCVLGVSWGGGGRCVIGTLLLGASLQKQQCPVSVWGQASISQGVSSVVYGTVSFQRQLQFGPQKIRSEFCVMIKILTRAASCIRQSLDLRTIECIDLVSQGLKREPQKPFWPPLHSMVISFSTSGEVALRVMVTPKVR